MCIRDSSRGAWIEIKCIAELQEKVTVAPLTGCVDRNMSAADKAKLDTMSHQMCIRDRPNAIRMQSVFSQRPLYAWRILEEALNPYYQRLAPGLRYDYRNITQEITENLLAGDSDLDKKLDDVYLLGYYHQRSARTKKKDKNVTEDESNESAK